jgi:hypothetical protein
MKGLNKYKKLCQYYYTSVCCTAVPNIVICLCQQGLVTLWGVQNLEKVTGRKHSSENLLKINNKVNLMVTCPFGRTLNMISHYCSAANAPGNKQREDNSQDHTILGQNCQTGYQISTTAHYHCNALSMKSLKFHNFCHLLCMS